MDHPEGAGSQRADRVNFDRRVRLEFRGTQLNSDGGLLVTSLQTQLIKIGARVVRHARAITFQLAEVAVTGDLLRPTIWTFV